MTASADDPHPALAATGTPSGSGGSITRRAFPALVLVGIVLLALNLRGPLVAVSTVTEDLRVDVGMSGAVIGLLTSLPVLCFGLAAPPASLLIARTGLERAVLVCLGGLLVGLAVRSGGGVATALIGTVIIGLAITIGNVVTPVIIGRDFPNRVALMTGVYTAAMNVGAMLVLSTTPAVAASAGWQLALAIPALLIVVAGAVWLVLSRRRSAARSPSTGSTPPSPAATSGILRRPTTWLLTAAFAGQAFSYYGLTAWLPTLLAEELNMTREAAGSASSIFQILAVVGAFGTPLIIARLGGPVAAFAVNGVLWVTLPLGLLLAPQLWPLWSVTGGIAQGGGFVAIFTVVVYRSRTLRENRQLSAVVQAGGYVVACLGPVIFGALHDVSAEWTASLLLVVGSVTTFALLGGTAARGAGR